MSDIAARLRAVIQEILDEDGDGWQVSQFVLAMGIERFREDTVEASAWYWAPPSQPDWMTAGLLESAVEMRACAETE